MKCVLIMAGGTGGHVFPALAIAQLLQQQGNEVHWLGTPRGLENEVIPKTTIPLHHIQIAGWRGKKWRKLLVAPFVLARALLQARKIIKAINPDVVIGMGGFASGPGGLAARMLGKTLVVHEQNAVPGLTNKVLSKFATTLLQAFPDTFPDAITTGNPLRSAITEIPPPAVRFAGRTGPLRLLVVGGSLGAMALNQAVPNALSVLSSGERPLVWHQTGAAGLAETRRFYSLLALKAQVDPFIENMAEAYAWADLVICRAGALTVSELIAVGLGSILVPYPYAADQHQLTNANYLIKHHAAQLLPQQQLNSVRLAEELRRLFFKRSKLLAMAEAARKLYVPAATERVVEICLQGSVATTKEAVKAAVVSEKVEKVRE
jgi:UDP-N-acetylglucosamine--N-acetylmuramyl-(pentapeptide) pyrophosphoryl-undecaprenol N-acetylglucosamine transferase